MAPPRCSVITPTWNRHDLLLERCVPSVQAQGYLPWTEHLVISDGPDPVLKERLAAPWLDGWKNLWYDELPVHAEHRHYGNEARRRGIELATGDLITYLDDDDAYRPLHCQLLASALDEHPEAGFALSRMVSHIQGGTAVIGDGPPACGNVGTPMIMHRRSVLDVATWGGDSQFEDWELVWAWMQAGIKYVQVDADTVDVWPSVFR